MPFIFQKYDTVKIERLHKHILDMAGLGQPLYYEIQVDGIGPFPKQTILICLKHTRTMSVRIAKPLPSSSTMEAPNGITAMCFMYTPKVTKSQWKADSTARIWIIHFRAKTLNESRRTKKKPE